MVTHRERLVGDLQMRIRLPSPWPLPRYCAARMEESERVNLSLASAFADL
jgi:hypothetical protein